MFFKRRDFINFVLILCVNYCCAQEEEVVVVRRVLQYDQIFPLGLNSSIEYIIEFIPNAEQQQYPGRLSLRLEGGDVNYPVLITARQRTGAVTWQLPHKIRDELQFSMDRTLCFFQSNGDIETSDCAGTDTYILNGFSLHIATTCNTNISLAVYATPARDWLVNLHTPTALTATPEGPTVHYYSFLDTEDSVRLEFAAEDEICAMVSIQNRTCPISQTEDTAQTTGLRMTMLKSAGVQLSRRNYPSGFYVVVIIMQSDEACLGEEALQNEEWLWRELVIGREDDQTNSNSRNKNITITLRAALTRGQYAIAASATFGVFLLFYVGFILLVYAQRWPPFAQYVLPVAPPSRGTETEELGESAADGVISVSPRRRRRRGSNETFDSSDNSDTDDEETNDNLSPTTNQNLSTFEVSPPTNQGTPLNTYSVTPTNNEQPLSGDVRTTRIDDVIVTNGGLEQISAVGSENTNRNGVSGQPESQGQTVPNPESVPPFGLPPRLRVAALSKRKARVLRARSDRYLTTLYTVAVFYALPVVQFVTAFQIFLNVSGSLDTCYYNFLCAHPAGAISDFNHIFSNLGYLMLGALFMLQVRRRRMRRRHLPHDEEYGIPPHYGMLSSLGAGLMMVALLSASYHVCPNRLNFQFDTAFMYVLSVLCMVKIYQSRHPDVNARAHVTFGVLAVLIALVVWGVLGGGPIFWAILTLLHIFTFLMLSLRIYYVGQFRLEKQTIQMAARGLAQVPKLGVKPIYKPRLILLLIANGVNWFFALNGLWTQEADFASHLLTVLLGNTLMYVMFYLIMKLLHGERPRWYAWCFLASAAICWAPALYFFVSGSSDWSTTPAQSRHKNHTCNVMQFYDAHDLWHLLSAAALYLTFNALLTWDDGLANVKRTEIAVF